MFCVKIDYGYKGTNSINYENVNIQFEYGDFINILGENGCGKSTLYKVLMGRLKPTNGHISDEIKNNIVVISDYVNLPNECTIHDIFELLGEDKIQYMKKEFYSIYEVVSELLSKKVSMLSTGQKRIVEIFCALSTRKRILVMDEASNGLDVTNKQLLIEQVNKMVESKKVVVFNTTHLIEDVISFGGRVFVMNKQKQRINEYHGEKSIKEIIEYMKVGE